MWQKGGISKRTMYENLQRGEIASAERTFEEEEQEIADELPTSADIPEVEIQWKSPPLVGIFGASFVVGKIFAFNCFDGSRGAALW